MYGFGILFSVVMVGKGKFKFLFNGVAKNYNDNFLLKFLKPLEFSRDFLKTLTAIVFRGALNNQVTSFAMLHIATVGIKLSSGTPLYTQKKWKSGFWFALEVIEVISYFLTLTDTPFTDLVFFSTIILQILLVLLNAFCDAVMMLKDGKEKSPDRMVAEIGR